MIITSFVIFRPVQCHLKELCKASSLGRYRCFSSIPVYRPPLILPSETSFHSSLPRPSNLRWEKHSRRLFSQNVSQSNPKSDHSGKKTPSKIKLLVLGFGFGALVGLAYIYQSFKKKIVPLVNLESDNNPLFLEPPPIDLIAKKVVGKKSTPNLQLTLFQYEPCPFCKKVRAYLDYAGLNYDVVEVNPVTKKQLGWSAYKKVPVVVVKVKEGYLQLNDSSMIISSLASLMADPEQDLLKIVKYYPKVDFQDVDGKKGSEIMNRYFLMFGDKEPNDRSKESIVDERRWRKWSDDVLMHTLSPNIYRSWDEALEAFNMFSKNGEWERIFSSWERQVVIYVGAAVMYVVGKRLKKRHNILDDARQSLYNEVNYFLNTLNGKGTRFIGGEEPNLADLAIYGCISSIDGTRTFADLMHSTRLSPWYEAMCNVIESRRGKVTSC